MGLEYCFDNVSMIDPDLPIGQNYTLKELCKTNQSISTTNYPSQSSQEFKNLCWLASVLEELESRIGPFELISGFRCPELQSVLNPSIAAAGKKGFHEAGMAVDIWPKESTVIDYFCKILTCDLKEKLGEIAIKPTQNTLHLSLPTERTRGLAMEMDSNKVYRRLTAEELQTKYIDNFDPYASIYGGMSMPAVDEYESPEELSIVGWHEDVDKPSKLPLFIGIGTLLFAGLAYFGIKLGKK